ncbi:unnamed protein product [Thelazia callipaeda]|uniref:PK_Tyr_Ser-Thr domain-containing protein n=1 Tax=Thelazia callipaeda TaxID=103827 RepID=A0A0N5D0Y1_THECL|nr:unnamed protein product [Thelazia callipaeda]
MVLPDNTPEAIITVMNKCFTQEPEKRPSFADLFKLLAPHEKKSQSDQEGSSAGSLGSSCSYKERSNSAKNESLATVSKEKART